MTSATQTAAPAQPIFHTNIVALNAARHGGLKLNRDAGCGFAAGATTVPIGIGEFETAAHSYPILFTDGSPPIPVVLLGFRAGWNLFVNDTGGWMPGAYVPALVRAFPFVIIDNNATGTQEFGFEADAACISPSTGQPLFENDQPAQVLRDALAFCNACQTELNASQAFGAALERAQLLTPQSATIEPKGGAKVTIDGFRTIDRARLAALNDEVLLAWRSRDWLLPLYAHLFSAANWLPFTELATRQLAARK
jgi:hypothetical protein